MSAIPKNMQRLPSWLKKRSLGWTDVHAIKRSLRKYHLHTICEEAKCPNLGECFSIGTATFLIMGNMCTRRCAFCSVMSEVCSVMEEVDLGEPRRVAMQIREMGLSHAVISSVTRDDMEDGGAGHFAKTIEEIKHLCPKTTIEVLTPDFKGRRKDVQTVCKAGPFVYGHNIETIERLTPLLRQGGGSLLRHGASYRRSLDVLAAAREFLPRGFIKSGLMVGFGETEDEVKRTLADLRSVGTDIVTIGQYLRPSKNAIEVRKYIEPAQFAEYEAFGLELGFRHVFAGPFVRSSYHAGKIIIEAIGQLDDSPSV